MLDLQPKDFIEGGATGISVLLVFYLAYKDKIFNKTLNNHLEHFTEAMNGVSKVIAKNSEVNGKSNETNKSVARILNRVEDTLNRH